jgi:hypothetical protein
MRAASAAASAPGAASSNVECAPGHAATREAASERVMRHIAGGNRKIDLEQDWRARSVLVAPLLRLQRVPGRKGDISSPDLGD